MWAITLALVVSAQLGDAAARLRQGDGGQACEEQLARAREAYERREYEQARAGFAAALTHCGIQPPILQVKFCGETPNMSIATWLQPVSQT